MPITAMFVALALGGTEPRRETFDATMTTAARRAAVVARDAFDLELSDYASARFRDVRAIRIDSDVAFCGLVNAKNSMGAYVGWQSFGTLSSTVVIDDGRLNRDRMVAIICAQPDEIADTRDWSADLTHR